MSFSLSNDSFLKSISNQLQQFGVDSSKHAELKAKANSIFTQYDTQKANGKEGKDGFWNATESQNASNATSELMIKIAEMANNVAEIVAKRTNTATSNPVTTSNIASVVATPDTNNVEQAIIDKVKAMPPQEQADFIWSNLNRYIEEGGQIKSFDGDNITIVDKDGAEHKESLKAMGMSDEGIKALTQNIKIEAQGDEISRISDDAELITNPAHAQTIGRATKIGYDNDTLLALLRNGFNISIENGKYKISDSEGNNKGFISLVENGSYSFDTNAKFTNLELTVRKYENQGYEIVKPPTPNKTEHTIEVTVQKDGKTQVITINPKTGFEIKKEEH